MKFLVVVASAIVTLIITAIFTGAIITTKAINELYND